MNQTEIAIIGGGPAGLSAALSAAELGAQVTILERYDALGGQLVKQTHKFFGSKKQYASERGIDIAQKLAGAVMASPRIDVWLNATVLGIYEDGVITVEKNGKFKKLKPEQLIIATGAAEKMLAFPNNDLPGICGAGAVQTLMNVHGIMPGRRVLMVGAGNIGIIVSYQLLQAGVEVAAIIDAAPFIGGYLVHAAKVRRAGVPIYTSHAIKRAVGKDVLEGAYTWELDDKWQPKAGTEKYIEADIMCLAVGLTPLAELLWQAGCEMRFIPELGGHVAWRDGNLTTSVPWIHIAGDVAGIEEASAAMVEGRLAGLTAAHSQGYGSDKIEALRQETHNELTNLRAGQAGAKTRSGLAKLNL